MSTPKIHPNYYAVIPASVRYDSTLSPTAKLLYGEIAALCNQEGFCWANNSYFAGLYDLNAKYVSGLLASLVERGHIVMEVDPGKGNTRNIYLAQAIPKNLKGYSEKPEDPLQKNLNHNNTINNTSNSTTSEDSKNVRKIYNLYLKHFKCPDYISTLTEEGRAALLARAEKRYKLTDKRREAIKRRLKDAGFNMVAAAIVGYSREPWYQGENDSGWTADLEKFICRSYEKIEEGANKYEAQKAKSSSNDPWQNM